MSNLSVGVHTITASVTDSGGLSDSAAIEVTIVEIVVPPQPDVAIDFEEFRAGSTNYTEVLTQDFRFTGSNGGALRFQGAGSGWSSKVLRQFTNDQSLLMEHVDGYAFELKTLQASSSFNGSLVISATLLDNRVVEQVHEFSEDSLSQISVNLEDVVLVAFKWSNESDGSGDGSRGVIDNIDVEVSDVTPPPVPATRRVRVQITPAPDAESLIGEHAETGDSVDIDNNGEAVFDGLDQEEDTTIIFIRNGNG